MVPTRRNLFSFLAGLIPFRSVKASVAQKVYTVETLEHHWGDSRYVARMQFRSEEEATTYVQKLIPFWHPAQEGKVEYVTIGNRDTQEMIPWSNAPIPLFTVVSAWGYLMAIRINGKHVNRPRADGSTVLSEYVTMPFRMIARSGPYAEYSMSHPDAEGMAGRLS